ncbi:MAG: type II and III secretion system protein family protein [Oleispira sp.]
MTKIQKKKKSNKMTIKSTTSASVKIIYTCMTLAVVLLQSHSVHADKLKDMTLLLKQGQLIQLPQTAKAIFIANPEIASYQAPSSQSLFLFGQSAGITTLYVLGKDEKVIYARKIQVKHDIESLSQLITQQFPDSNVNVISTANRLILMGSVSTPQAADQIRYLSQGYLSSTDSVENSQELINQLSIDLPTQVNIRVRIAEMDRGTTREFGLDTTLDLGYAVPLKTLAPLNNSLSAKLKALEQESLVSILAEPNLTTVSGESAQFLSGGEIPISVPVAPGQPVSFEYRQYGVALDIVPTVLSSNRISLKVKPSVSEVSYRPNTSNNGAGDTPVFSTRMASTTVELASGQSFILGGLLHERENTIISEIPLLSDIPILGALFRSEKYERKETELVIIATAYIVEPSRKNDLHIPQQGMEPYDHWQRFLYGRILKPTSLHSSSDISSSQPKMFGDYGFIF